MIPLSCAFHCMKSILCIFLLFKIIQCHFMSFQFLVLVTSDSMINYSELHRSRILSRTLLKGRYNSFILKIWFFSICHVSGFFLFFSFFDMFLVLIIIYFATLFSFYFHYFSSFIIIFFISGSSPSLGFKIELRKTLLKCFLLLILLLICGTYVRTYMLFILIFLPIFLNLIFIPHVTHHHFFRIICSQEPFYSRLSQILPA